jgi:mono/diheme cytochrome c family protein
MRCLSILALLLAAGCERQSPGPQQVTFDGAAVTDAAAVVAHGKRLTYVLGCSDCHGANFEGSFFTRDHPEFGPLYASNLTLEAPKFSDAQLEGLLRTGVHPTRGTVWAMPSQLFQNLSPADMKAVIAYVRTLRPSGKPTPLPQFSVQDRKDIAAGNYKPAVQMVKDYKAAQAIDLGPKYALGRYIASVTCAECHGSRLEGDPMGKKPDLVAAGAYSRAEFDRLITQGVPTGGRTLKPMMAGVARSRFSHLTPHERDALYAYLKARAERS